MLELSAEDRKLLAALDEDSRLSSNQLARKTRIAPSTVNYKIDRFVEKGVVDEFYVLVNPFALQARYDRLLVSFRADWDVSAVKEYCKSNPKIGWYIVFDGRWNFGCQLWSSSVEETQAIVLDFLSVFSAFVQEHVVSSVVSIVKYEHSFLGTKGRTAIVPVAPVALDEVDKAILRALYRNARMKLLSVAAAVKKDYKLVAYRLKRLEKQGVILGYKLKLNRFNYEYYKVRLEFLSFSAQELLALKEYLLSDPRVLFVTSALGWADLEFEVFCSDQKEYRSFQNAFRKKFAAVVKTYETLIPLEFEWGRVVP